MSDCTKDIELLLRLDQWDTPMAKPKPSDDAVPVIHYWCATHDAPIGLLDSSCPRANPITREDTA